MHRCYLDRRRCIALFRDQLVCCFKASILLTLLLGACRHTQCLVTAVGLVGTSVRLSVTFECYRKEIILRVELLIAASLQGSANVHKSVTLHLKLAVGVSRVGDGRRRNATKGSSEGLEILSLAPGVRHSGSRKYDSEKGR